MFELFRKYREVILYLFFGGLTFLVSIGSFALFHKALAVNELIANVISWVLAVLFAFFTNRIWVFQASTKTFGEFFSQLGVFCGGRVATLLLEEGILLLFVSILKFDSMAVKIAAQVLVVVANYFISKWVVFRESEQNSGKKG